MFLDAKRLAVLSGLMKNDSHEVLSEALESSTEIERLRKVIREEVSKVMSQLAVENENTSTADEAIQSRRLSKVYR